MGTKTLYRSVSDKKMGGICGGLAEYMNLDATLIRLIVALVIIFSGGTALILYILACFVIPEEPGPEDLSRNIHQGQGSFYRSSSAGAPPNTSAGSYYRSSSVESEPSPSSPNLDEMMKEVEKKAMQKEIEELRAKLKKYEQTQNHDKGES